MWKRGFQAPFSMPENMKGQDMSDGIEVTIRRISQSDAAGAIAVIAVLLAFGLSIYCAWFVVHSIFWMLWSSGQAVWLFIGQVFHFGCS